MQISSVCFGASIPIVNWAISLPIPRKIKRLAVGETSATMYLHERRYIGKIMQVHISQWGNSLALRLPADYARSLGVKAGDSVEATLTPEGGLSIRPCRWDRGGFANELAQNLEAMNMGTSVMQEVRRGDRY
jgi:antitoxin MazE